MNDQTSQQPADSQLAVLITGCGTGFGHGTAVHMASEGHRVFAGVRKESDAAALSQIASCQKLPLTPIVMDVTDTNSIRRAVGAVLTTARRLDVLVNNAGIGFNSPVELIDVEAAKSVFDTNVFGAIRTIKAVLPTMRAQGSGTIVNVSSTAGFVAWPFGGVYSASKHALEALSDALYYEVAEFGIRVVIIQAGRHPTAFAEKVAAASQTSETSPYAGLVPPLDAGLSRLLAFCASGDTTTPNPMSVITAIASAATDPSTPRRVTVGSDAATLSTLKHGLDDSMFERVTKHIMYPPRDDRRKIGGSDADHS